jgi:hypothetical protein
VGYQVNFGTRQSLSVTVGVQFNTAQPGVLETYGITACNQYPSGDGTLFDNVTITQWDTQWADTFDVSSYLNWTTTVANMGSGPACAFQVTNSHDASNGNECNLLWGMCTPGSTQTCCPYSGGCAQLGDQTCTSGRVWGSCTGAVGKVCSPGAVRACCAFPGGCGCAGDQFCNDTGTGWGGCADSSPKGSHCL